MTNYVKKSNKFNNVTNVSVKYDEYLFVYRLFVTECDRPIFSVCVSLYKNGEVCDEKFVYDISSDENEAVMIFDHLCNNTVTPYSLDECIDAVYDII